MTYTFQPSRAAGIVGLSLFLVASLALLVRTVRARTWFMLIPTVVGLLEVAGYACRISMLHNPLRGVYIAMECLLIIPPSFLALVDYMVLGRVVAAIQSVQSTDHSKIKLKPKWLTWIFFACEIGSLFCQGAGAGLSVGGNNSASSANSGRVLLIIGLTALVILISFFTATAIYTNRSEPFQINGAPSLRIIFHGIYATVSLLLIRNVFRLVEFSQGWEGYLADHEVFLYIFDTVLMLFWIVLVIPLHFGVYLNRLHDELTPSSKHPAAGSKSPHQVHAENQPEQGIEMA